MPAHQLSQVHVHTPHSLFLTTCLCLVPLALIEHLLYANFRQTELSKTWVPYHLEQILNSVNLINSQKWWERDVCMGWYQCTLKKKLVWKQTIKIGGNCNHPGKRWQCLTQGGANRGGETLTELIISSSCPIGNSASFFFFFFWLKTTEIYSHTVLEAGILKSRCWQGLAPSEGSREESFFASSFFILTDLLSLITW